MSNTDNNDSHIVVIENPMDQLKNHSATDNDLPPIIHNHPLAEVSQSPGHLLLLKLWQREEERLSRRVSLRETQIDGAKRLVFHLCCFFFAFHAFSLFLLFAASAGLPDHARRKWWIVTCLSLLASVVVIFLVHLGICRYRKAAGELQRERADGRALGRCVQELRMKGASFDLSKEPVTVKRLKSSSVEVRWRPLRWFLENVVTFCLVCFTALVVPAGKFILCG